MEDRQKIRVLLVEDNAAYSELVRLHLQKSSDAEFSLNSTRNGREAMAELRKDSQYDVVVVDYFLPGQNGDRVVKMLRDEGVRIPVVLLTVNRDVDLVAELMKTGIEGYLIKDDTALPDLPGALLEVVGRVTERAQRMAIEVSKNRLEVIRSIVSGIAAETQGPIQEMRQAAAELTEKLAAGRLTMYSSVITENLARLDEKLSRLRALEVEKTVVYVRDIKMLDLS